MKYDYQPGKKDVYIDTEHPKTKKVVAMDGQNTLMQLGKLGFLTGQAKKDYELLTHK
jgi:hypothetical protein